MSVTIETERVVQSGSEPINDETRDRLRKRMARMLNDDATPPEMAKKAMEELEKFLERTRGASIEMVSAETIVEGLEKCAESLKALLEGITTIGYGLNRSGKGKAVFETGEAMGMVVAAGSLLTAAAVQLRHAVQCPCHTDEPETIPPPAPGPEAA